MEEINNLVAELTVLYKTFQEKPTKQTSASFRKSLMKLKNSSHALRKNVLLAVKPAKQVAPVAPIEPVAPVEPEAPVEQVEPLVKKRKSKSKKEKQKITKETKATTVKFN